MEGYTSDTFIFDLRNSELEELFYAKSNVCKNCGTRCLEYYCVDPLCINR